MATTTVEPGTAGAKDKPHRPHRHRVQGRQDHAVRGLRPQRDLRAHHRSHVRNGRRARVRRQAQRHRVLLEDARVLPEPLAQLQRRARTHAVGRDRSDAREPQLVCIGVSGDGDTASIGIGQFMHLMRRNLPIIYIIEDNGVYGLTKGQFSATADLGSKLKSGVLNDLPPIDTCALAIQLGATFVGRSFSGDKKQLSAMLKAAIAHKGTVMLDVVSPCVTFNDHEGSTKSYKYVKEHEETLQDVSFVPHFEDINVEYDAGSTVAVTMHDGSRLHLRKLEEDYDPTDKIRAMTRLTEAHDKGEVLTGVFYVNPEAPNFIDMLNVVDQPLATLPDSVTRPGKEVLDACMEELK